MSNNVAVTVNVPEKLWDKANHRAQEEGVKPEELVINALRHYLGAPEQPNMAVKFPPDLRRRKP